MLTDSRRRTLELQADLTDEQMRVPLVSIINPFIWEMGHVAWFQERWTLRHLRGLDSIRPDADALWDSAAIPHDTRWDLPLPSRAETLQYMQGVLDRVLEHLPQGEAPEQEAYFHWLVAMHEDMHDEAFTYTRQTLGYAAPPGPGRPVGGADEGVRRGPGGPPHEALGDVEVPGGEYLLGACPGPGFVFDNEKWAHPVKVEPFRIARTPVTYGQFAAFVDEGGYGRQEFWSDAGWSWRERERAGHPVYWLRDSGPWQLRHFDQVVPLPLEVAILHVNWFEAEAWCRWAGRRLPTEAEWELAATGLEKRRYPWGDTAPEPEQACLDFRSTARPAASDLAAGDSPYGCRQMIGGVWEWTSTVFEPYPGFVIDPYKEYSQPWFGGEYRVLRGGCWATRSRLIRSTWRNFYTRNRRDVFGGFRTCPGFATEAQRHGESRLAPAPQSPARPSAPGGQHFSSKNEPKGGEGV